MSMFVTITNVEYYDALKADAEEGETYWSISRQARPGDQVLLYVCKPVAAVVAVAEVSTAPEKETRPSSEFFGLYFSEMHALRLLALPLTRDNLMEAFPGWGYWKQPRQSIRVPNQYAASLSVMVERVMTATPEAVYEAMLFSAAGERLEEMTEADALALFASWSQEQRDEAERYFAEVFSNANAGEPLTRPSGRPIT